MTASNEKSLKDWMLKQILPVVILIVTNIGQYRYFTTQIEKAENKMEKLEHQIENLNNQLINRKCSL